MLMKGLIIDDNLHDDTKLYRYLTLSQFLELVEKQKMYLTNISSWQDIWEMPISKMETNICEKEEIFRDNLYGQCWSLDGVSDALWQIYSKEKDGILIETSVKKIKSLENIKMGILSPVIYYESLDEMQSKIKSMKNLYKKPFINGLLKRKAFEHEKEVRLITLNNNNCLDKTKKDHCHVEFNINPIEFIENIIIDPRSNEWFLDTIFLYCKRVGFKIKPKKSDLF